MVFCPKSSHAGDYPSRGGSKATTRHSPDEVETKHDHLSSNLKSPLWVPAAQHRDEYETNSGLCAMRCLEPGEGAVNLVPPNYHIPSVRLFADWVGLKRFRRCARCYSDASGKTHSAIAEEMTSRTRIACRGTNSRSTPGAITFMYNCIPQFEM